MEKTDSLNQSFVYPHFIRVPGLTALTTGRLPCRNFQAFGRQSHWSLNAQILGLGSLDQFLAYFLQRLDFSRGEGHADFVNLLSNKVGELAGIMG